MFVGEGGCCFDDYLFVVVKDKYDMLIYCGDDEFGIVFDVWWLLWCDGFDFGVELDCCWVVLVEVVEVGVFLVVESVVGYWYWDWYVDVDYVYLYLGDEVVGCVVVVGEDCYFVVVFVFWW